MKVRAPKARMLSNTGDQEADLLIHAVRAKTRLDRIRKKSPQWKMAAATASDRRLLVGRCVVFKTPRQELLCDVSSKLEALGSKPKKVQAKIEELKAGLAKLVELADAE